MNNAELNRYKRTEISKAGIIATMTPEGKKDIKLTFFDSPAEVVVSKAWAEKNKAEIGKVYIKESSDKEICRTAEWFNMNYTVMPS